MKRALICFAVLVAGAVIGLPYLVSGDRFRPVLERQLSSAVGKSVSMGRIDLELIPPSLRVRDVSVEGLGRAEEVSVRPRLGALLSGNLEVDSLVLIRPAVRWPVELGQTGGGKDKMLFRRIRVAEGSVGEFVQGLDLDVGASNGDGNVELRGSATVKGYGRIRYDGTGGSRWAGTFEWSGYWPVPVTGTLQAETAGGRTTVQDLQVRAGNAAAAVRGSIEGDSIDATISLRDAPLAELLQSKEFAATGTLSADLRVRGPITAPEAEGPIDLREFVLRPERGEPFRIAQARLSLLGKRIEAKPFSLTCAGTQLTASGSVEDFLRKPVLDVTVETPGARIEDLAALAKLHGVPGIEAKGTIAFRARISGPPGAVAVDVTTLKAEVGESRIEGRVKTNGPNVQVDLTANTLDVAAAKNWWVPGSADASGPRSRVTGTIAIGTLLLDQNRLENVRANVSLANGSLTLDPFSAAAFQGKVQGRANVAADGAVRMQGKLERMELEPLLAAATPLRRVIRGPLTADVDLAFRGKTGEEISRALTGTIALSIENGQLLPLNLIGTLGGLVKDGSTPFLGMRGTLRFDNGVAATERIDIDLDRAAARLSGTMHLLEQTLDLRLLTTMNKQLSDEVGKTAVGPILSAAVASPNGELMIPSLVRGTFSKPVVTPDASAVGKLQADRLKAGFKGLLDSFKKKPKE